MFLSCLIISVDLSLLGVGNQSFVCLQSVLLFHWSVHCCFVLFLSSFLRYVNGVSMLVVWVGSDAPILARVSARSLPFVPMWALTQWMVTSFSLPMEGQSSLVL